MEAYRNIGAGIIAYVRKEQHCYERAELKAHEKVGEESEGVRLEGNCRISEMTGDKREESTKQIVSGAGMVQRGHNPGRIASRIE